MIRHLFHNPYRALEKGIGYSFRRKSLLATALIHRSLRFECGDGVEDNQRLEFLGDAALSLVAGDYLFRNFPELREGDMTMLRSRLTSGKALAGLGQSIRLGDWLQLGRGEQKSGGNRRPSNITDAFEAVIGAAFLDGGIVAVSRIFHKLFLGLLKGIDSSSDQLEDNPKGRLQELVQRRWKTNPHYRVVKQTGPAHARIFFVQAEINGQAAGLGRGACKRDAEQDAARDAVERISG
ncbi:MAG: ribonuclease III [Kiritimatiellia bacterium]